MADETTPNNKKSQPVNDVSEPGKSAPSPTSKPVLVTNRPIMKDPMVVDDTSSEDSATEPKETLAGKGSSKTIKPLDTSPKPTTDEPKPEAVQDKPTDEPQQEVKEEPEPADEKPAEDSATEPKSPAKSDNDKSDKPAKKDLKTPDEKEDAEAARKAERDANLQKIVDAKTYYLPINAVEKRRTKRVVIIGIVLSIILVLAWVDIALDAGLIKIDGVEPVTHIFST